MTDTNQKLQELITTIKTLRGEAGCPWDKKQTPQSLAKYIKAECEELLDAISNEDNSNICEESGDLLFLIIMLSEIYAENNSFNLQDVITTVNHKLIRRHPHVFSGTPVESEEQLKKQWEAIKAEEKQKKSI